MAKKLNLEEQIETFVKEHLPSDPANWCKRFKKPKIIHDNLWGTFKLDPHEVALLDTPLLQRLRFIHQTGGVYLTFPSAHHTRFEHTLGVIYQASQLCNALCKTEEEPGDQRIDPALVRDIRFAALIHDTGHGPFSHTSEQFFSSLDLMTEYRQKNRNLNKSGAGEILSFLISKSKHLNKFIKVLNNEFRIRLDAKRISQIITGLMNDDEMYISEIIHGPFDADKLDYMPRDALFSGLQMKIDIDRLHHSIFIKTSEDAEQSQTRIAGRVSGLSPLMQIMFNKMLLFTGMYHHHKVRTVDSMLWAIFYLATKRKSKLGGVKIQSPVDFLNVTDDYLLVPDLTDDDDIKKIITDIRNRHLWKKALIIARNTVPEEMHNRAGESPKGLYPGLIKLEGDSQKKFDKRREIANKIWKKAGEPCMEYEVWIDLPKPPGMKEAMLMWIQAPGVSKPKTLSDFIPVKYWVELYGTHQSKAHVFCPPDVIEKIGKASEDVLYEMFGLKFLPQAQAYKHTLAG